MRPILWFAIQKAKRYRKKHGLPDRYEITGEEVEKARKRGAEQDYDCTTVKAKLLKGLTLEKVELPHCGAWFVSSPDNPKDRVLYYIHGGGFVYGSTRGAFPFVSHAVRKFGYNVFSVDYRLAPDHKCLDTLTDCEDGYRWLLERYAPENVITMGESAGGNLVLALPQKLRDDGLPMPGGIIASSPVVQFRYYPYSYYECSCKTDFGIIFGINDTADVYRGELPADHPYVSPLCGDLSGYPPVYLDASDSESLRDEARMMYVKLRENGQDAEYHELRQFFHAMLPAPMFGFVRREEYPHVLRFIARVFGKE